jgi:hypothetical protein
VSNGQGVQFNYQAWVARYPEFAPVPQDLAQLYFDEAGLYYSNCGWTASLPQAPTLLNMLTAHIAWLYCPKDASGNPAATGAVASQVVGRITNASQGSVSVAADMGGATDGSPSQAFFMQTKYGSSFWFATSSFRTGRYIPPPFPGSRVPTAIFGGRRFMT